MIRVIISLIILSAVAIMAVANEGVVQIHYLFGTTPPLPLYVIIVGSFIISGVVFMIILLPAWIRDKLEIRKLRRALQKIESERGRIEETTIQD